MQPPYTNPSSPDPYSNAPVPAPLTADEKNWAMACHLASLSYFIGIPFGNVLGPLVVWMMKRDSSPFINEAGKKALNFNLAVTIYLAIAAVLCLLLIGFIFLIIIPIVQAILAIIAALKASNGEDYDYPMTIKFLN